MENFTFNLSNYKPLLVEYGTNLAFAIIVLIVGLWITGIITRSSKKAMLKSKIDESLVPFLSSLISSLLKILVVISALGMLGVEMTSFIALLGAAGLAVGMALSGTLQNFAGGVMLLVFKPFKVGDYIEAQGHSGTVTNIQIFNTILTTPDNKVIIIPNGGLSTNSMVNYSEEKTRRVEWNVGISYGDDAGKAQEVLKKIVAEDSRILKDPAPFVEIGELGDSAVVMKVRVWVNGADYWDVLFETNKKIYEVLPKEGLSFPFPQMDVHLDK